MFSRRHRVTVIGCMLIAVSGCIEPGASMDEPTDGDILEIRTKFVQEERRATEQPGVQLPTGTPARGLQLLLIVDKSDPGEPWRGSKSCTEWLDQHRNLRSCEGVPKQEAYVVPPAGRDGTTGPESPPWFFPFDSEGTIRLLFPEPMDIRIGIHGMYPDSLKRSMADPESCDHPIGGLHKVASSQGVSLVSYGRVIQVTGPGQLSLEWLGGCVDDWAYD